MPEHFVPWTEEEMQAIRDIGAVGTKEGYEKFNSLFPGKRTFMAYCNVRSRRNLISCKKYDHQGRGWCKRQIGDEHVKSGYIYVKIADPDVWISKSKYVYIQNHPDYVEKNRDNFVFLDGNTRNFSPDNIELVRQREATIYQMYGGNRSHNPNVTRINILRARLKLAMLDRAEEIDRVIVNSNGRKLK